MLNGSILMHGFGLAHGWWANSPRRAAGAALIYFLLVAAFGHWLGISWHFTDTTNARVPGFFATHWGILFSLLVPLAAWLMSLYFRALDSGLLTLDSILKPSNQSTSKFSEIAAERFRYAWPLWIFPVSLALPIVLTLAADGRDIIAPLASATWPPSADLDWSTRGFECTNAFAPGYYLAFNVLAFSLQIFVSYCGFLFFFLTTYHMGLAIGKGIAEREIAVIFKPLGTHPPPAQYRVDWKFSDDTQRCGLGGLDIIFMIFVALNFVALGASIISIEYNLAFSATKADAGSLILAFFTVLFIPVVFIWVLLPYYTHFPRTLPKSAQGKGFPNPSPWPWGSAWLTKGIIVLATGTWAWLAGRAAYAFKHWF